MLLVVDPALMKYFKVKGVIILCNLYFVLFVDMKMKLHLILAPLLMLAIIKENLEIMAEGNLKLIILFSVKIAIQSI